VASFKSTLAEVRDADLLVHVRGRVLAAASEQKAVAEQVLEELGVEKRRVLLAYNKTDRPSPEALDADGLRISAASGRACPSCARRSSRALSALGARLHIYGVHESESAS